MMRLRNPLSAFCPCYCWPINPEGGTNDVCINIIYGDPLEGRTGGRAPSGATLWRAAAGVPNLNFLFRLWRFHVGEG